MYQDSSKIRKNIIKIRLNDEEKKLLKDVTAGGQEAAVARDLIIENILNKFDPEGTKALNRIDQNERINYVTKLIEKLIAENNI